MHGGLRYLQQLNFVRMRDSIRSRNIMMSIDPKNVKPMGFFNAIGECQAHIPGIQKEGL